ncbi:hypothetical protein ATANTOWER_021529 [Ataeniobius toweri]|uniref:PseI/NeuA/B-like domain-containing protein n=1 Tax=Ataeniobius toweri TaxID=208326 RepID=A0ABU7CHW4_9TELE|nr:hypothetical protein [Ataeniobius toweri]
MDEMAVKFLHEIKVPFFKVASADANNFPYLEKSQERPSHGGVQWHAVNGDDPPAVNLRVITHDKEIQMQ